MSRAWTTSCRSNRAQVSREALFGAPFLFHPVTRRLSPINRLVAKKPPVARRKNPMSRTCLAVILAAGDSTRKNSAMSKVLHPVAARPMNEHGMDGGHSAGDTNVGAGRG